MEIDREEIARLNDLSLSERAAALNDSIDRLEEELEHARTAPDYRSSDQD